MYQLLLRCFLRQVYSIHLILKITGISVLSIPSIVMKPPFSCSYSTLAILLLSSIHINPSNNYLPVVWVEAHLFHYHFQGLCCCILVFLPYLWLISSLSSTSSLHSRSFASTAGVWFLPSTQLLSAFLLSP